jgi:hypothetical protein
LREVFIGLKVFAHLHFVGRRNFLQVGAAWYVFGREFSDLFISNPKTEIRKIERQ